MNLPVTEFLTRYCLLVVLATGQLFDGFPISADLPTGSKEARAEPFAAQCEAGTVALVRGAWNSDYVDELCLFPMSAYADQVDASSGADNCLSQGAHVAQIHGDLITSADAPWADFDPVEVHRSCGIDIVFDDRDQYQWWRQRNKTGFDRPCGVPFASSRGMFLCPECVLSRPLSES
jgi:hypothetical protein